STLVRAFSLARTIAVLAYLPFLTSAYDKFDLLLAEISILQNVLYAFFDQDSILFSYVFLLCHTAFPILCPAVHAESPVAFVMKDALFTSFAINPRFHGLNNK